MELRMEWPEPPTWLVVVLLVLLSLALAFLVSTFMLQFAAGLD